MEAHRTFCVARSTIDDWREQVGHFEATVRYQRGPAPAICDLGAFEAFARRHQEQTLAAMKNAWHKQSGQSVSCQTLSVMMKKIGWTRKKRALSMLRG